MTHKFAKSISEARAARSPEERNKLLSKLADKALKSRKLGRAPRGQALSDVYQDIYKQIRTCFLELCDRELDTYNSRKISSEDWVISLRDRATKNAIDERALKRLALEAQKHPPGHPLRRHALEQLVEAIQKLNRFWHPHRSNFFMRYYQQKYEHAVQSTLTYVCEKIDNYDPDRGQSGRLMNWVNTRLRYDYFDMCNPNKGPNEVHCPSLDELESLIAEKSMSRKTVGELVGDYIREDPDNICKNLRIRSHPEIDFQKLWLARVDGHTFKDLSDRFGISIPTLSSFWKRSADKLTDPIKQYVRDYGDIES